MFVMLQVHFYALYIQAAVRLYTFYCMLLDPYMMDNCSDIKLNTFYWTIGITWAVYVGQVGGDIV